MDGVAFLDDLKAYVGFTDASSARLRALHPLAAGHIPAIVDDFYAAIEAHPGARASITGGPEQIARLKETLRRWTATLLLGPHDAAWLEGRLRIGRVHVRIDLPQAYMFTAIDRIRVRLAAVAATHLAAEPQVLDETVVALHQVLDIELAIMLETYREDLVAKSNAAERLATLGQFASGIGHELRNPLGIMESSLFLLRQNLAKAPVADADAAASVTRHLDKIGRELARSNKTINDLLDLARNRPPRRQRLSAASALAHAIDSAHLPPEIVTSVESPPAATVDADLDQLSQLVGNLLTNAAQAMNGRGRIWLSVQRRGDVTEIRVRDEGPGVAPDVRHRIFEALFTTKARGTGLGLALCRRIAEAHGGTVTLEADLDTGGAGSSFLVAIPDAPVVA